MRLAKLAITNYRSIEKLNVAFPTLYSALSGKNDSGKTNIIRCIRAVFGMPGSPFISDTDLDFKRDITNWKKNEKDQIVSIVANCVVDPNQDAGLHLFLCEYLKLKNTDALHITLSAHCSQSDPDGLEEVTVSGNELTKIQSQEVISKLQSTNVILFHNSTESLPPYFRDRGVDALGDITGPDREALDAAQKRLNSTITRAVKQQQKGLEDILGRLKDKYKVGISIPEVNLQGAPLGITLGDDAEDLERWGSGTQNRTKTLLTLFRARRRSESETSASKVTPIVIIEEPESFLHPSAQAEFGRMLHDLATEFQVQVIVATHSPYMLSCQTPESNLLIERRVEKGKLRESTLVDTNSDRWMEPFGLALGISNDEFEPWRKALFKTSGAILLVEGSTDVEYFNMLSQEELKGNRLLSPVDVVSYGGFGNIISSFFLKFLLEKHGNCVVTYDLDVETSVLPTLQQAGFQKGVNCFAMGSQIVKSIEGLLPASISRSVLAANPDIVNGLAFGDKDQKKSSKDFYKKALLEEFKKIATPTDEYFKGFYPIVKGINKALHSKRP